MKFRNKILAVILPVIILSAAGVSVAIYRYGAQAVMDGQEELMRKVMEKTLYELDHFFEERLREGLLFSKNPVLIKAILGEDRATAQNMLEEYLRSSPVYENLYLTDAEGVDIVDAVGAAVGLDLKTIPAVESSIKKAMSGQVDVTSVIKSPSTGRPVVGILTPIYNEKGTQIGMVGNPLELNYFSDKAISHFKVGENGFLFMVDETGTYLAHPKKEWILKQNITQFDWGRRILKQQNGWTEYDYKGQRWITHFRRFPEEGWTVAASMPVDEFMSDIYRIRWITAGCAGGSLLLCFLFVRIITDKSLIRPVNRAIEGLSRASEQVVSASGQVSASCQSLADGASRQAASIEETSASLEEMTFMTQQNVEYARQADRLMHTVGEAVREADQAMSELTGGMKDISDASKEISKIIKTIDEIAFQTNLLALNAAVEAARAGETGAGFAVVAGEVRSLAGRSADAAKNTAEMIEGTVKKIDAGTHLADKSNNAFAKVADSSGKVGELIGEIAAASGEQARGIDQINHAISEIDKVIQNNAASAEESASAAEEMSAQSEEMRQLIKTIAEVVSGKKEERPATLKLPRHSAPVKEKTIPGNQMKSSRLPQKKITARPEEILSLDDADFDDF